jgi:hypothetical protein
MADLKSFDTSTTPMVPTTDPLRDRALRRLKSKRDLVTHALVYVLVNTMIVVIWAVTTSGFFWPAFPMAIWGVGLLLNAWDVWRGDGFSEAQIAREVSRLRKDS